jgi:hypothetical protein
VRGQRPHTPHPPLPPGAACRARAGAGPALPLMRGSARPGAAQVRAIRKMCLVPEGDPYDVQRCAWRTRIHFSRARAGTALRPCLRSVSSLHPQRPLQLSVQRPAVGRGNKPLCKSLRLGGVDVFDPVGVARRRLLLRPPTIAKDKRSSETCPHASAPPPRRQSRNFFEGILPSAHQRDQSCTRRGRWGRAPRTHGATGRELRTCGGRAMNGCAERRPSPDRQRTPRARHSSDHGFCGE